MGERRVAADELAFVRGTLDLGDRAQGAAEGKPYEFALQAKALGGNHRARTGPAAPIPRRLTVKPCGVSRSACRAAVRAAPADRAR